MTGYGPPDDPSEAPTGFYDFGNQGDPERGTPWYRKPVVLLAAVLFAAMLLGLAIYFLADQTGGTGGAKQTPTSPTTPTTAPPTTEVTTTEPVAPPETTTMTFPPSTTEPTTAAPTTAPPTTHERRRRPPPSPPSRRRDAVAVNDSRPPYDGYSRAVDETERFSAVERPWYLKRWVLALWGLTVVILIAGIIWGLAILARGNGGSAPAPAPHGRPPRRRPPQPPRRRPRPPPSRARRLHPRRPRSSRCPQPPGRRNIRGGTGGAAICPRYLRYLGAALLTWRDTRRGRAGRRAWRRPS